MKILNQEPKLCTECGKPIGSDDYDDYGIVCHRDCATEEINETLQYHYYNDLGDDL